jgi:hypothetical protein
MRDPGEEVSSDDLARGVDARHIGAAVRKWIIDRGENAPTEKEPMGVALSEISDDLARVVDPKRSGIGSGAGFAHGIDRCESPAAQ